MNFKKTAAIVAAAGALTALAIPAMAETTIYGSARMATFYNFNSTKNATGGDAGSYAGFDEHLQGNSRFGIDAKSGDVGGKVEFGTGVNTRLLYGTWNFGSGKLTVGQDYNSYYTFVAQTHGDDNGFNGYGALWDGRQAQLRVNMNNGLYFAAITPYKNNTAVINPVAGIPDASGAAIANSESTPLPPAVATNIQLYMPKLNVGYAGKAGNFGYNVGVVGQSYKDITAAKTITALLGYVNGTAAFGATSLMYNLSYAQNAGNLGFAGRESFSAATTKRDALGFEGYVQLTQKVSDTVSANVGFGYVSDDRRGDASPDNKMSVFVNAPIVLAKNVIVTPEFSYYDELKSSTNVDQGKSYAVGAQWKVNF